MKASAESAPAGPPLVLVIEEDEHRAGVFAGALTPGARVVIARDVAEARGMATELRPDLIVCDPSRAGAVVAELGGAGGTPVLSLGAGGGPPPIGLANVVARHGRAADPILGRDERMRSIVDNVIDGILTIDQRGIITTVNAAAERIFGYGADELIGQNVRLLMPEPYHSEHDAYLANYVRTGVRKIIGIGREVVGRRKDGSTFPMDLAVGEFYAGDRRQFTGIVRDITERKRAEEELRRAKEEAEEASRAKDRFLAVLSHELRTPLTPVLATISYVEGRPDVPEELRDEITSIRRNVELEARLIDDLLDLTRIGHGKLNLEREVVDAHASLRSALEVCQVEIESKGFEVSMALHAESRHVLADPARIQQVFWNLIKNAVKFTPPGGRVGLRSANEGGGLLRIEVTDTGAGIEAGFLPRIFNAFEQGDPRHGPRRGGLGLGLAIAKMLVDLHGGSLAAASAGPGGGSTFTVRLPTVSPPATPKPRPAPPARPLPRGLKILFVEDNPDTLRATARLLRLSGFVVREASSVGEALLAAAREPYDLLLSDIGLPDGSGLDVMRDLRVRYGLRGIAFSGYGTDDDIRASLEAGFEHHLTKPVNLQTLVDLIARAAY